MENTTLKDIAMLNNVDKYGFDDFHEIYEPHIKHLRNEKINLVEIGVGGYNDEKRGGESLRMWKDYFATSNIYGIDIYDKSAFEEDRIKIFQGSQSDVSFLEDVYNEIEKVHLVVDDGSHVSNDIITTFKFFFPRMENNGIYIIEDLGTSYWPEFGGGFKGETSMNFLKRLTDCLNHTEFLIKGYEPNYFDQHIKSIHFYRNAAIIFKGDNSRPSTMVENGRLKLHHS